IEEPMGGAHKEPILAYASVKEQILKDLEELKPIVSHKLVDQRVEKFSQMGVYTEVDDIEQFLMERTQQSDVAVVKAKEGK
ncbi:MAG: hypothetical protein AAFP83_22855, partial [Bacteroidota bacterium]